MSKYLKGNYEATIKSDPTQSRRESVEEEFYRRALEKLGGSIAFILKSKKLLWRGDTDDTAGD